MKKAILLLIVVLMLPLCHAYYNKSLYKDWMLAGKEYTIENQTYKVAYIKGANVSRLYFPGVIIELEGNTCQKWGIYSVCKTKEKFEKNGHSIPLDDLRAEINTSVFLYINRTNVQVMPKLVYSNFSEGVKSKMDVRVDVIGTVTKLSYEVTLPENFTALGAEGCSMDNKTFKLQGSFCTIEFVPAPSTSPLRTFLQFTAAELNHVLIKETNVSVKPKISPAKPAPGSQNVTQNNTTTLPGNNTAPKPGSPGLLPPSLDKKIEFDSKYIIYGIGGVIVVGIIVFIISKVKGGKSGLDKEIEDLKKSEGK